MFVVTFLKIIIIIIYLFLIYKMMTYYCVGCGRVGLGGVVWKSSILCTVKIFKSLDEPYTS